MIFVIEVDNEGFKVFDSDGTAIDPAKESSLQSVLTALSAVKDTDGIKKITDALPAGTNLLGKATLSQGGNDAAINASNRLLVEALIATGGAAQLVRLETGDGTGHIATVDSSKRLLVSTGDVAPVGTSPVKVIAQGDVGGGNQADTDYTVPDGKKLALTQFFAGGETSGKESKFELYHSDDGGATDGTLLAFGYIGDGGQNIRIGLNYEVTGNGTDDVIRMRRERIDAATRELAAAWIGNVED